jgi:hypothetical protein
MAGGGERPLVIVNEGFHTFDEHLQGEQSRQARGTFQQALGKRPIGESQDRGEWVSNRSLEESSM